MAAFAEAYHNTAPKGSLLRAVACLLNRVVLDNLNGVFTAAGCAQATTTTQVKTTNSTTFMTDGTFRTAKGATDNFWTLTGSVVPVSSFQKWLLCVNSAGAASVIAGNPAATANAVTFSTANDGVAVFGVCQVATDATHTFTPGTTALNAAGITATFSDGPGLALFPIVADMTSGGEILEANGGNTQFYLG